MADWDYVLHVDSTYAKAYQPNAEARFLLVHGKDEAFQFLSIPADDTLPPLDSVHQAYYYAAVRGTGALLDKLDGLDIDTHKLKVQICTSKTVADQVMGKTEVDDSTLFYLCAKVRALLSEFGQWEAVCKEGE